MQFVHIKCYAVPQPPQATTIGACRPTQTKCKRVMPSLDEPDSSRLGRRNRAAPHLRRKPSARSARPAHEGVALIGHDQRDLV